MSKHCICPKHASWVLTNQTGRLQTYAAGLFVPDLGIDIYGKGVYGSHIEIGIALQDTKRLHQDVKPMFKQTNWNRN